MLVDGKVIASVKRRHQLGVEGIVDAVAKPEALALGAT